MIVVAAGAMLIWLQLINDPEHKSVLFLMVGHLGMAFVIAGVLGLTIEQFTKVRHDVHRDDLVEALNQNRLETIDDLQRHVLRAVYRRALPDELIDSVEAEVFQTNFLRKRWDVTYELRRVADASNCVSLRTVLAYEIQNVSKIAKPLTIPTTIDMSSSHFASEHCGLKAVEVDGRALEQAEIQALIKSGPASATCVLELTKMLEPGETIQVRLDYVQLNPEEATEFLSTRYPASAITVTAITPQADFELSLVSLHQAEPVTEHSGPTLWKWTLGPALFPGQGTALIWRPIKAQTTACLPAS